MKMLVYFLSILNACLYHQTLYLHINYLTEFSLSPIMEFAFKKQHGIKEISTKY